MHSEHLEKGPSGALATNRLSPGAAIIVIALCSLAAWGAVLELGAAMWRVLGR